MSRKMPNPIRNLVPFCREGEGNSAVEFALVAPFLILLTLGIIDFGRIMWAETTVEHISREAARYASLHGAGAKVEATKATTESYAEDRATGLDTSDLSVAVTYLGGSNASGSSVTVGITYDFDLILSEILGFNAIELDSSSTFTIL